MLPGFNHNLRYKERVFHVQTEDAGPSKGRLVTQVFIEGNLISIQHGDYSAIVAAGGPNEALRDKVRVMMQEQHKTQMKRLVSGEFDDKIAIYIDAPSNAADHLPDDPVLRAMAEEEAPTLPPGQSPHPFADGVPTQRPAPSVDRSPPSPTQPGRTAPASFPDVPNTPPPAIPPHRPITNDLEAPPPRAATPAPVVQTPGLGSRPPGPPIHQTFRPPPHTPPERPAHVPPPQAARPGALPLGRNPSQSHVSSSSPLGLGAKPNRGDPVLPAAQNPSEIPSFRPPRGQSQPRLRNPSNVPLRGDSTAFLAELDREMLRQTPINPPRRGASQSSGGRRPPPPAGAPPALDRSTVKERPPKTMAEQRREAASARSQNQPSERPAFARNESGPGDTLIDSTIPESLREAIQLRRAQSGIAPLPDGTPPPNVSAARDLPPGTLAHRAPDGIPPAARTRQDRPAPSSVVRPRTPPPDANTVLEMDARELKKTIEEQRQALKERRAADQHVVVTERSLDEALASYLADED